jgi:hypothetical protein
MANRRCTIVGCGPNGQAAYNRIDWASLVILVNGAITLMGRYLPVNMLWLVSDNRIVDCAWFKYHYHLYGNRLFGSGQVAERVKVAHQFQENPWFVWGDYSLIPGVCRGGGSGVGCAMQLAHDREHDITLCGVDMSGSTSLSHPLKNVYGPDHWDFKKTVLNALIAGPMPSTRTISKTELTCLSL